MAFHIARLVRSALLNRCSECRSSIVISRYASSSSSKPDSAAGSKPEEKSEVAYQRKSPGSKPQVKAGSSQNQKTTAAAAALAADKAQAAPESKASNADEATSNAETGYTKKSKTPPAKPPEAAKAAPTPKEASAQDAKTKTKAKPSVTVSATTATTESPPQSSPAVASEAVKEKEDGDASKENDPPKSPSPEVPFVDFSRQEIGAISEVGYKRKVMPLPEDRTAEAEAPEEAPKDGTTFTARRTFQKLNIVSEYDYSLPLPKIIKVEPKKKEPVSLSEAIQIVKSSAHCKFIETVEAHIQLGVDPKRSDQIVRGAVTLPNGSGKSVKVAVFADGTAAEEALAAGADVVGTDDLVERVFASGGKLDFEKCIAIPSVMPKLGKIARILGPRGMMPNPKMGTVTLKVAEAVKAAKQGRVDFRADKTAIVHAGLGKVNFTDDALYENIAAFAAAVLAAKPVGFKKSSRYGGFFNKFYLCCTMGPGVPVTIQSVAAASDNYLKTQEAAAHGN